jgi:hypothetical protein
LLYGVKINVIQVHFNDHGMSYFIPPKKEVASEDFHRRE